MLFRIVNIFSPFLPQRPGEILALSCFSLCKTVAIEKQKSSITLDSFYPVTGQTINCAWTVFYKPFLTQNRLQVSEHFHIWIIFRLRVSAADWWSCLLQKASLL